MHAMTGKGRGGRNWLVALAAMLLAALLVSGCKSEARQNCEKAAKEAGADSSPCKNL